MEVIQKNLTSINNKKNGHIKLIDLNSTHPSSLSPQSSKLSPDYFERVCTELFCEGHLVKFKAPGDSMNPTICNGDLITVQPIKPSEVIAGDIILYRHEYGVVAHRVMKIKSPQSSALRLPRRSHALGVTKTSPQHYFALRGDAALNDDDPVGGDQILGKVVSIERNNRHIDPYCLRSKLLYKARRLAVSLKRFLSNPYLNSV